MSDLPVRSPQPSAEQQPFFDAAREGRLSLPTCDSCGFVIWMPRERCPECHHDGVTWNDCSGTGRVYSFTVVQKGQGRWRDVAPYVVAYVEIDEGPRIMTNLVDVDPDAVAVDMAVAAVFDTPDDDGYPVLRFGPAS